MRSSKLVCRCSVVLALFVMGCKGGFDSLSSLNPWKDRSQLAQGGQLQLAGQNQQLQAKLNTVNTNNEQLHQSLAESQQEAQLARSKNELFRKQLSSAAAQLARLQGEAQDSRQEHESLLASTRRRGGAMIEPNNSFRDDLPVIDIPGVEVRRDGERVRVHLPASQLFPGDDAQLTPDGGKLLEAVVDEIDRRYADHRIGVEGHTDSAPLRSARWADNHQLSLARANAVFNYLVRYTPLRTKQLSVAGHGGSRPSADRQRNHRIELVIYPERVGR